MENTFKKIRKHFRNVPGIATGLGITRQAYYEWEKQGWIPELRCYQLQVLMEGKVKAKSMIKHIPILEDSNGQ